MLRRSTLAGLVAAIVALGCGSDDPTGPVNIPCTIAYTGAETGTFDCTTVIRAIYTTANDTSIVSGGGGTSGLAVNIQYKGAPKLGQYKHSDANAKGFVSAAPGATGYIAATVGYQGQTATGSWTINLTSVTDSVTATGKFHKLHGTIDATMTPFGGATNLVVKVTF